MCSSASETGRFGKQTVRFGKQTGLFTLSLFGVGLGLFGDGLGMRSGSVWCKNHFGIVEFFTYISSSIIIRSNFGLRPSVRTCFSKPPYLQALAWIGHSLNLVRTSSARQIIGITRTLRRRPAVLLSLEVHATVRAFLGPADLFLIDQFRALFYPPVSEVAITMHEAADEKNVKAAAEKKKTKRLKEQRST